MFGTTRYSIADDTFNDSEEKLNRVLKAIEKAKLPNFEYVCYLRPELLVSKPKMVDLLIDLGLRGAWIGLESFRDDSRKVVGRSGEFKRIREQVCLLKQKSKHYIGTLGSFVVGLPHDSIDEIYQWNEDLCQDNRQFLDLWFHFPLFIAKRSIGEKIIFNNSSITSTTSETNQSLIEKNPGKYGYTIVEDDTLFDGVSQVHATWKNKHMDSHQATNLCKSLWLKKQHYVGIGGWYVATGWHHGLDETQIANSKFVSRGFKNSGSTQSLDRYKYWDDIIRNDTK
jgi:hypothetical protein